MSKQVRVAIFVVIFTAAASSHFAIGQGINCCSSPSYAPIWQQFGNVNPYSRPHARPIWHSYSRVRPTYAAAQTTFTLQFAPLQNNYPAIQPSNVTDPAIVVEHPTEFEHSGALGHSIEIPGDNHEGLQLESANDARNLDLTNELPSRQSLEPGSNIVSSEIASAEVGNAESGDAEIAEGNPDAQPSPSDLVLDDQQLSDQNADDPDEISDVEDAVSKRNDELEALKAELETKEAENQKLTQSIDKLKTMVEGKILEAIKDTKNTKNVADTKKLIEDAIAKEKKAAAWEMAKARKEAEKAKSQLNKVRQQAENERELLLKRVQTVESKLKENRLRKNNEQATDPKTDAKKGKTLVELAIQKRKQRAAADVQRANQSSDTSVDNPEDLEDEMNKQIERAVGKIKRRFESKIERLSETDGTDDEVKKLDKEMRIQTEKMEARIRKRYKRRMQSSNQRK